MGGESWHAIKKLFNPPFLILKVRHPAVTGVYCIVRDSRSGCSNDFKCMYVTIWECNIFPVGVALFACTVQRKESIHYNGVACREAAAIREAMFTVTQK